MTIPARSNSDQHRLTERYQELRETQVHLIESIASLKDRSQQRQQVKLIMPTYSGRASIYPQFKKDFLDWAKYLSPTEKKTAFVKAIENHDLKQKIITSPDFDSMMRVLDSYHGNSLEIASKIFSELKMMPKPQIHFENIQLFDISPKHRQS